MAVQEVPCKRLSAYANPTRGVLRGPFCPPVSDRALAGIQTNCKVASTDYETGDRDYVAGGLAPARGASTGAIAPPISPATSNTDSAESGS